MKYINMSSTWKPLLTQESHLQQVHQSPPRIPSGKNSFDHLVKNQVQTDHFPRAPV